MNQEQLAQVVQLVVAAIDSETRITVAVFGFAGVVAGALIAMIASFVQEYWKTRPAVRLDRVRKGILRDLLSDQKYPWRKLSTLSRVIGADEQVTKRLLIEVGARGSEKSDDLWGLISRHPLSTSEI